MVMSKYVVFKNNNEKFALNISQVERIIEFEQPKQIPDSSRYLLGICRYKDNVLPIIDLTTRLYNLDSSRNEDDKVIVVLWKGKTIGIVVDHILGVNSYEDAEYEETNIDTQTSNEYILGFIKTKEDIIIVLDLDKIFNLEQEEEILSIDF